MEKNMRLKAGDTVTRIAPDVYQIDDAHAQTFYLIEGTEKALLIDTGMERRPLRPVLRELTDKPIVLALTHAHPDHMYHADEFAPVYLGALDIAVWSKWLRLMARILCQARRLPRKRFAVDRYLPVTEQTGIEIGGNRIEVIGAPGHTPGSVLYVDRLHRCLFTGDAFGSGMFVLMALPACLTVSAYRESLRHVLQKLEEDGLETYQMLGGHRNQERGAGERGEAYFNPVTADTVRDMITLCGCLLSRSAKPEGKGILVRAKYGRAEMQLRRGQIR